MLNTYLHDKFGKRYILKKQSELVSNAAFQPMLFNNESQALQFVRQLKVPTGYWSKITAGISAAPITTIQNTQLKDERQICKLLCKKQVSIYELVGFSNTGSSSHKRSFEKSNGDKVTFSHASTLLVASNQGVVDVNSPADAEKAIADLPADKKELLALATSLNIQVSSVNSSEEIKQSISAALISKEVVVTIQPKLSIPPKPTQASEVIAADKPVALAPETEAAAITIVAAIDAMSNINQKSQAETLKSAAEEGKPFCEECEAAKQANK